MYEMSPVSAVVICDPFGVVLDASPAAKDLYGADLIGRPVSRLSPPAERGRIGGWMEEALAHGHRKAIALRHIADGRQALVDVEWVAMHAGERRSIVEVSSKLESTEVSKAVRDFVHVASHALMEPARAISCFVALLSEKSDLEGDDARRYLAHVRSGSERIAAQIAALARYSHALTSPHRIDPVPLGPIFAAAIERMIAIHRTPDAVVERDRLPEVRGDPEQLEILAECLIDNAIKFRAAAPPRLRIRASGSTESDQISVSDNGIGIATAQRGEALKLLRQLERRGGVGLGLSLAQAIVAHHGGHLWLDDSEGGGLTVSFTLPRWGGA